MLKKWWKYILIIAFCLNYYSAKSQEYFAVQNVSSQTELQSHNILCMAQDSQGFIWIGTNWGLFKYDGYHFKEYNINSKPSIVNNNVKSLLIVNNELWIGTKGGLTILNTENNTAVNLTTANSSLPDNYITHLFKDSTKHIWLGYYNGLLSKHIEGVHFQNFDLNVSINENCYSVVNMVETSTNTFYIKLKCNDFSKTKIAEVIYNNKTISTTEIAQYTIENAVIFNYNNSLGMIAENKLMMYDSTLKKLEIKNPHFVKNNETQIITAYQKDLNTIYVGTEMHTVYVLNSNEIKPSNYIKLSNEATWVNAFFKDESGLLWVGSPLGLYKVKNRIKFFEKYLDSNGNKMRSIIEDSVGDVYALNQTDIFKYDTLTNNFKNLNWKNLSETSPYYLENFSENSFLVGMQGSGLAVYNKNTNVCEPYFKEQNLLSGSHIIKIVNGTNNIIWLGTLDGLYYIEKTKNTVIKVHDSIFQKITENKESVFDIKPYNDDELWVATSSGLFSLKVNNTVYPLRIEAEKIAQLPYTIRCLFFNRNTLWLATQNQGIIKYNYLTKKVVQVNENQGLANNTVYSILPRFKNELWFGTLNGLSCLDTVTNQFLNFYVYDGLADNEFNSASQLKTKKGALFFGGQNGISQIIPTHFEKDTSKIHLNISNISWYNSKKDSTYSIAINNNKLKDLELPYSNAYVNFELSLTDYFKPNNTTFKYRLLGLHNDWHMLNKTNVLSFTNLPPGDYTLDISASTNYGKWNEQIISLPIAVKQIFYKKWWFITSLFIIALLSFYFIRTYELNHIKKLEKLRLRISRDLHDELGSTLTGIAIRSELLKNNIAFDSKEDILNEIALQSRTAVDSLSDIVWAIDSRNNSLEDLTNRMDIILFQLLKPKNITYTFLFPDERKLVYLDQDYRQHVYLLFKEAITNVVKHSNATHVTIEIVKFDDTLKLTIKDNGTFTSKTSNRLNGNGIKNMRLRAEKINGNLQITALNGFCIELTFNYLAK